MQINLFLLRKKQMIRCLNILKLQQFNPTFSHENLKKCSVSNLGRKIINNIKIKNHF